MKTTTITISLAMFLLACQPHEYAVCVEQCEERNTCLPAGQPAADCDTACVHAAERAMELHETMRASGMATGCEAAAEDAIACTESFSCEGPAVGCDRDPLNDCIYAFCTSTSREPAERVSAYGTCASHIEWWCDHEGLEASEHERAAVGCALL